MNSNNLVLTTLSQNPEYFEEVISLIEEEFHYSDEHSYEKDFAPLVHPSNFENCFLYVDRDSNAVAAHLAVCIRILVKADVEIKIALIGGIVTNKKYRGKNLFTELMDHSIRTHHHNVALFILWSDLEGLYEKFYFYRASGLIESGKKSFSASERPGGYEKTTFSLLNDKEFNSIVHLYHSFNEKYFFTIKREDKDWSIIRDMNSIDLYVKKNTLNEIERYFCVNKGQDLSNIIHEISCSNRDDDYFQLLKEIESFTIWLPETEIKNMKNNKEIFYNAFIKLGSMTILNEFLKKISNEKLKIIKMDEDFIVFQFLEKDYEATSKDFLQYLFGPKPLEEFASYGLSLFIAGADSV